MPDKIVEYGKQILFITRDLQGCKEQIEATKRRDDGQDRRIEELTEAMRLLTFEVRHNYDMNQRDRENLLLRLENAMLRFERRLPPPDKDDKDREDGADR